MASVNKAILIGSLGRDPEVRFMPNGEAVCNFSIATSENWKDKQGQKQEKTEWHNIVMYRKLAEIAGEYLKKGSPVYLEGRIQTRKWQDKEGNDRYSTEIIADSMQMLGKKDGESVATQPKTAQPNKQNDGTGFDDMPDDIPFINIYRGKRAYSI